MFDTAETSTDTLLSRFWDDLRRPATYQMLVVIVALSMKAYSLSF